MGHLDEKGDAGGDAIELVSLDQLLDAAAVPSPALVKVDVEGAEGRVLEGARGMLASHYPKILLAAHGWRRFKECQQILGSYGYRLELVRDGSDDGDYAVLATWG